MIKTIGEDKLNNLKSIEGKFRSIQIDRQVPARYLSPTKDLLGSVGNSITFKGILPD
jgi:hypothetical protein